MENKIKNVSDITYLSELTRHINYVLGYGLINYLTCKNYCDKIEHIIG